MGKQIVNWYTRPNSPFIKLFSIGWI